MHLHPLGEEVRGGLVARARCNLEHAASRARHSFMANDQLCDHFLSSGNPFFLWDARELAEFSIGPRGHCTQGSDSLSHQVDGEGQLAVLRLEHQVQSLKHGASHVPVEVVSLQVEGVGVSQYPGEAILDLVAIVLTDADVDVVFHGSPECWTAASPWLALHSGSVTQGGASLQSIDSMQR